MSNESYITFQISDNLFWGYRFSVLRDTLLSIPEENRKSFVCSEVKNSLLNVLRQLNLRQLMDKLSEVNFHIHTHNTITNVNDGDIVYICGHC